MERTNEMWVEQFQDDNPPQAEAIKELRQYLKRNVLSYLYSRSDLGYLASAELEQMSEDFTQEALLKIQAKLDTFQGRSKFTTWATKIVCNHAISELRRAKWRDLSLEVLVEAGASLQENMAITAAQFIRPDIVTEQRQVWQTIISVINNDLSERQRQVLAGVHFGNIPMAEVARQLDTNVNNIYKLMHDARLKLRWGLRNVGLEPEYIFHLFSKAKRTDSRLATTDSAVANHNL